MKHEAKHSLPVSRGYGMTSVGGHIQTIDVRCGLCKGSFDIDVDWVDRWVAFELREVERQRGKGRRSAGQLLDWEQNIDRAQTTMRTYLKQRRKTR